MALYRSSLPKQKRRPKPPLVRCDRYVASSHGDVRGLEPLGTLDHVELDLRAFLQGAEAVGVDGAEVHEDILTSAGRDETETLRVVEPLDRTVATHSENLLILCSCCTRGDSEALHLDPASHRLCNQQGSPPSHSTPIQMAPTTPAGEGSGGRQARRYLPLGTVSVSASVPAAWPSPAHSRARCRGACRARPGCCSSSPPRAP